MSQKPEYIVVGSGPTGAMAAQTLVEAGKTVTMLDVGNDRIAESRIPETDFLSLRRTDPDQYKYFLGNDLEGVTWGKVGKGEQVTPGRQHMMHMVDELTPSTSEEFSAFESLAYGGLGVGWGIGCWEWSETELKAAGLGNRQMLGAYQEIADRIGISATKDGAQPYTIRNLSAYMPSPRLDRNHTLLYEKYLRHKDTLRKRGFVMGRAPLALLTEDRGMRKGYSYKDMDFYTDQEKSAYRPWITIDELRRKDNFTYVANQLVVSFDEKKDCIAIRAIDTATHKQTTFKCVKLILTPGVMGSARIVMRSFAVENVRLPLLCNPYSYVPCLQLAMLGKEAERHKLGFAELSFFLDEAGSNFGAAMASLYSYQSLMAFRMVRQVPLDFADARPLLQYLMPGIIIMGIHQPDSPSADKYMSLRKDSASPTGDSLSIMYKSSSSETALRNKREKEYIRAMRRMGVYAIKRIDPGIGASIHYGGCLPFSDEEKPFTLSKDGRIHGTQRVFVADGSGFTYLPAKGLTFSLMANAHIIAGKALKS